MRRWDPRGVAVGVVLAAWAGGFWFLLITGRWALYLGGRTFWVVPLGAALLTLGALGRLWRARTAGRRAVPRREAFGLALLALPLIAVLVLPPTTLGAYAVSRRSAFSNASYVSSGNVSGVPTFLDVAAATSSPELMKGLARHAGEEVDVIGFVQRDGDAPSDEFELTRFAVICCIPDALLVQVRVVDAPSAGLKPGEWVEVTGRLYPVGDEVLLDAERTVTVDRPSHPYLYP
jgi:uncharacterized repeat protein (TIGR03943 family)